MKTPFPKGMPDDQKKEIKASAERLEIRLFPIKHTPEIVVFCISS